MAVSKPNRRADLAGLRGVALVLVLLYHFEVWGFGGGFIGVDVFFVLSGYLICGNTRRALEAQTFCVVSFYVRRVLRLAPALLTTLVAFVPICVLTWPDADVRDAARSAAAASVGASNVFFLAQSGYFDTSALRKPLLHTWSLAVETQFYLIWPIMHVVLSKRRHAPIVCATVLMIAGMASAQHFARMHPANAFYLPHHRAWEFLLGAFLGLLPSTHGTLENRAVASNIVSFLGFGALLISAVTFRPFHVFPGVRAFVPCISTALLIATPNAALQRNILSSRILGWLGNVSYSVYLVHWPILSQWRAMRNFGRLLPTERVLVLISSLALGCTLHTAVEKPLMAKRIVTHKGYFFVMFFMTLAVLVSAFLLLAEYFQQRIAVQQREEYAILERETNQFKQYGGVTPADVVQLARRTSDARQRSGNIRAGRFGYSIELVTDKKNGPRVLFIGDSHAGHLKAIGVLLRDRFNARVEYWLGPACPPLLFVRKMYRWQDEQERGCSALVKLWRAQIHRSGFDMIILAARWPLLVEKGSQDLLMPQNANKMNVLRLGPHRVWQQSRKLFPIALEKTVAEMAEHARNVVIVSAVPILGRNPKTCKRGETCALVSRQAAKKRNKFVDDAMRSVCNSMQRASCIFLTKYLCDDIPVENTNGSCLSKMGKEGFYLDSNHLSYLGCAFLARKWELDRFHGFKFAPQQANSTSVQKN